MSIYLRVDAGMKFLDLNSPGWYKRIDLGCLDIGSSCYCVLAQIGIGPPADNCSTGNRYSAAKAQFRLSSEKAVRLGFAGSPGSGVAELTELTREWILLLKLRLTS